MNDDENKAQDILKAFDNLVVGMNKNMLGMVKNRSPLVYHILKDICWAIEEGFKGHKMYYNPDFTHGTTYIFTDSDYKNVALVYEYNLVCGHVERTQVFPKEDQGNITILK